MLKLSRRSAYAGNAIEEEDYLAEKLVRSGKRVVRLNRGDPVVYFPTPRTIIDAFVKALKDADTGYSYHSGIEQLRAAISRRHKRLYSLKVNEDDIIVTQGVSDAIMLLNSMLINHGDKAVILRPYYPLYMSSLKVSGGIPVTVDYRHSEKGMVDLDLLRKKMKAEGRKAKYMIFANPSNPLGTVIERKELKEMADIANEHDLLMVSDEIYDEIVYNGAKFTSLSEVTKGMPTIIFGGASKNFDATGFRIGYAIITGHGKETAMLRNKLDDFTKMWLSSNTPSQYAYTQALNDVMAHRASVMRMVKEIAKRTNAACRLINESRHMETTIPRGAYYAFPKIHLKNLRLKTDKEVVKKLLTEEGIQVTAGSGFGSPDHIRLVTLAPQDILEPAIRKIDKFLQRYSK